MINEIYHGDCYELIKLIDTNSIDLIVTDPPYGINYAEWDSLFDIKTLSDEWFRVLKENGSLFVFTGWSFEPEVRLNVKLC